jgi:hypothetical protein
VNNPVNRIPAEPRYHPLLTKNGLWIKSGKQSLESSWAPLEQAVSSRGKTGGTIHNRDGEFSGKKSRSNGPVDACPKRSQLAKMHSTRQLLAAYGLGLLFPGFHRPMNTITFFISKEDLNLRMFYLQASQERGQ